MGALFFALAGWLTVGEVLLYVGLAFSLVALALYARDGLTARSNPPVPSS